ncbi:TetR family transcriptional regulator [Pseudoroseomonas wenyumeiae]|uniref:TetR family transcriptional regulator n=2 Tax=Teichococcus wenyumeiae TaxID=2478470 RepID=A0A3A9JDE6_9PROT|nr:TetR/AcrR family transcriptional regulator [Pseudoroseomonas wenyumeiae]RMI25126.1 TetR family transcriptional regulator [Pseudoroseomonas wenyumeiae]
MITKISSGPGRPRGFDPEAALALGQQMFHARGYDAVGLAALTEAIGIKPPSFYKAFGSKAEFFTRILERYSRSVLALESILLPGRPAVEALAELLERAAETYARDPQQLGCLVLEAARGCADEESAIMARRAAEQRRSQIRAFVALTNPAAADAVTDYVASVMSGLSASAREGMSAARLTMVARAATEGMKALLAPPADV